MTFLKKAMSISALGITAMAIPAMASNGAPEAGAYNPATVMEVGGVVTAIKEVPGNNAMAGVHVTVKAKTGTFDVLVAPAAYLKLTRTNIVNGEYVEVRGSLVNGNVILGQEFDDNTGTLVLR